MEKLIKDGYLVQTFNDEDVKKGIIDELFEYLKQKALERKKKKKKDKYWENVVVFDDIIFSNDRKAS